jgi:hypothetical protein
MLPLHGSNVESDERTTLADHLAPLRPPPN